MSGCYVCSGPYSALDGATCTCEEARQEADVKAAHAAGYAAAVADVAVETEVKRGK